MYEKYFYLKENPFHVTPDTRFLFLSKKHSAAMDLMAYGVKERKGFVMLTGEVGMGKTTLSRALIERLPKRISTALILNPLLSGLDLLKTINADFGLKSAGDTVKAHLDALNAFVLRLAAGGAGAAVIIDEAQNLCARTLEMLRLLSNLETERQKLIQIVLIGQPELKAKLEAPELRQLNQRIAVRYDLAPLDADETRHYIKTRLQVAGGANVGFTKKALTAVFVESRGIPRVINVICDRTLTAAFVMGKKNCDDEAARAALKELKAQGCLPGSPKGHGGWPPWMGFLTRPG